MKRLDIFEYIEKLSFLLVSCGSEKYIILSCTLILVPCRGITAHCLW